MNNKLRDALLGNRPTAGAWIQIGHPAAAEVLAGAGFDWVCVDMEHGAIDLETAAGLFRTLAAFDTVAVGRLPANDPVWIHRVLDAGAQGLVVPMVNTAEEAQRAVREAKYPPEGVRGFGYSRANAYGADFTRYVRDANENVPVIVQIEHERAVANLEAIAAVRGVDGLFIGPYDLSGSMGLTGQFEHPRVRAALERFLSVCRGAGKAAGMHLVHPDEDAIRKCLAEGYTLVALGTDAVFLHETASRHVQAFSRRTQAPAAPSGRDG
jgi:2-keto-3-deoxy-L-rhamnonate aldolase RhmA